MIRILLADDHPVVRAGLRALFEAEADFEVVGEASTPDAAVELAATLQPDVILMDLRFGAAGSGADATRQIRGVADAPPVLVLTNHDADRDILAAVEAGAAGYLLKDAPPEELAIAVRAAAAGETALAPSIAARLLDRMRAPKSSLTSREIEVLELVGQGRSNAEIARSLTLSETTVKSHLVHIFTKLGVSSRTAAVARSRESGIL